MPFYHNIITQKSWQLLQSLRRRFPFVLIGGWAVFLYSHNLKSKDIDLIIDYDQLAILKEDYEVSKNERLKKYEIKEEGVDIDIYLPHYSDLGLDIKKIQESVANREGFQVPQLEVLFLLKLFAYNARRGSLKGKKDELDLLGLAILPEFDWPRYKVLLKEFDFKIYHQEFMAFIKKLRDVPELKINEQKMAKYKKEILSKFK